MIDLLNRRFVSFYFNRSGEGEGDDDAATAFVAGQTENPYAYFAAFSPDGEILGETELYADKDAVFEWALDLLADHPEFDGSTAEERALRRRVADPSSTSVSDRLAVARLDEELGDYDAAVLGYSAAFEGGGPAARREAGAALLRIARYRQRWERHAAVERDLRGALERDARATIDLDLERGRRLLATGEIATARALLQPLTKRSAGSSRHAEAHFYAGVACWADGDRRWAKLHWCWVGERMKKDRLWRRAYIAAAAEGMPYPNAELDGFEAPVGNIGVHTIVQAYEAAVEVHRELLPSYDAGDYRAGTASRPAATGDATTPRLPESPLLLVAGLVDGNEHVPANNRRVDALCALGEPALPALLVAIVDDAFPGRGYASWALSQVLLEGDIDDEVALDVLRAAAEDQDDYVRTLARSGLSTLEGATTGEGR